MKRKLNRRRGKKQRKIIVISLIIFLFVMVGGYAAFNTSLNIKAKGNIVEKSRVIQSWNVNSNKDFHTDYYRENIVSATFLDNNNIPNNAIESWNVSEDKDHGGVMAWIVQNSIDYTKYDLYIGVNGGVIANEDSSFLFYHFINLGYIEFGENFDTSNMINMQSMFCYTPSLISLDLSTFDTSKVTNMGNLFRMWTEQEGYAENASLATIIFGDKWNTSNVTNMKDVFTGTAVTSLDLSNWNTANVTNMYHMFNRCKNLETLNLCSFDTKQVTNMEAIFNGTSKLKAIYVGPNWIMDNVVSSDYMFSGSGVSSVITGQCS